MGKVAVLRMNASMPPAVEVTKIIRPEGRQYLGVGFYVIELEIHRL